MYIFVCKFMAVYNQGDYVVFGKMYIVDVDCIDIKGKKIKGVDNIFNYYVE